MARQFQNVVYLKEPEHVYIHRDTNQVYTSVTKVIHLVVPEFKKEEIAENIVKMGKRHPNPIYHGKTKEGILELWDSINTESTEKGTEIHEILERYVLANKWYTPKNDLEKAVIDGYESLNIDEGIEIYPERVLFSEEYQLAGTADLIIDINDVFFDVGDYKTNKVLRYFNEYGYQTLKPPFEHMQNCEYSIYSLQLSIYAYMYEQETGKKCRSIWIAHFDKETHKMTRIPIMYLKHEAKQLLQYFKYQNQMELDI